MSLWVGGRLSQSTVPRGAQSKPGGDADHRPWCRSGHVGCRTSLGRCVHGRRLMRAPVPFVALVDLAGGLLPNVDLCVIDQSQALRGPGQYRAARLLNRRHPGFGGGTALDDALKLARAGSRPRGEFLVSGSQMEASPVIRRDWRDRRRRGSTSPPCGTLRCRSATAGWVAISAGC
jgi:hypothetical protein